MFVLLHVKGMFFNVVVNTGQILMNARNKFVMS